MHPIIRIELWDDLHALPGEIARASVGCQLGDSQNIDGDPRNIQPVCDAWGNWRARGGRQGVRGATGYAVWMPDQNRFEILTLQDLGDNR